MRVRGFGVKRRGLKVAQKESKHRGSKSCMLCMMYELFAPTRTISIGFL